MKKDADKPEAMKVASRLSALLCAIGLHAWKEQRTIERKMGFTTAYMEGDVCQRCGQHKRDPLKDIERLPYGFKVVEPK